MPLFTATQLGDFVQDDVDDAAAAQAEQVVWGWLQPILKLQERPASPTPQVYGWALELGAIAVENPTGLASYQLGAERKQFSQERRREILADVGAAVDGIPGNAPRGCFPAAQPWPDPIRW